MNGLRFMRHIMSPLLLALLFGCVKEKEQKPLPQGQDNLHEVTFHAGWAPETKTVLQKDGSVWWAPEDEIALFIYPEDDNKYYLKSNCTAPSQETDFVGVIGERSSESTFYAIYPYDNAISHSSFTIPSVQYATAGSFSPGQFASFARSTDNTLHFYNLCAGIKFSVAHEGISKIVFKNREDYEPITGRMNITFWTLFPEEDWIAPAESGVSYSLEVYPAEGKYFIPGEYYYAALKPGNSSLVISFYTDTQVATTSLNDRLLVRSSIVTLLDKDKDLLFEDNDDYTYALLGENILPDGIDKNDIEEVIFHTSTEVTTNQIVPSSIPFYVRMGYCDLEYIPVYFEKIGTTAHYYTKADRYMMTGPCSIRFTNWKELRSIDLSMFCTNQVVEFQYMFMGCINLESVNLSSFDTSNAMSFEGMFDRCHKLTSLDISSFSSQNVAFYEQSGPFNNLFAECYSLLSLDIGGFSISGGAAHSMLAFARNSRNCAIRCTSSTRETLSNPSSKLGTYEQYITWVLPEEEIPNLEPYRFDYYSTDYSKDKTFRVLQSASTGKGINIVLMGDGYSDRMINDGSYDHDMERAMDAIFSYEPYATFKDYFNVFEVYAVSENEMAGESNTAFWSYIGGMDSQNGPVSHYEEYAVNKYARIPDDDINETCVVLILNQDVGFVAGIAYNGCIMDGDDVNDITDYAKGGSVAMVCRNLDNDYYPFVVAHEFGHGFAKLADEYIAYGGTMEDWEKEYYLSFANKYGWWSNLDFTDDSALIKWNKFLADERYTGTDIGIFEGATYEYGCWRPSQYSIMHNDLTGMFNAPSREAIYKRIHRLAFGKDWQYDYETFVEYDQKNIAAEKAAHTEPMYIHSHASEVLGKPFVKIDKSVTPDGKERIRVIMN